MPASSLELRDAYAKTAATLYDQYGIDAGWPGIVPWPATEAIVSIESGGENLPANDAGAIGLMQVTPNGSEADYYRAITKQAVTAESLSDPATNLKVGISGLANDEIEATKAGYPGWHYAGQRYFGGFANGAPNDAAYDGNTTGGQYRNKIVEYWQQNFGSATAEILQKNSWLDRMPGGGTALFFGAVDDPLQDTGNRSFNSANRELNQTYNSSKPSGDPLINVGSIAGGVVSGAEKVGKLYDIVSDPDTWLRVGIVTIGLAAVVVGMVAATK